MECTLIFDAVYQEDSKFVRETSKAQTALIAQSSLTSKTRHFDALTHNLYFCAYSGLQNTLKYIYIKLIYVFVSAHLKIGVLIKAGPQSLFPAEPGVKNG